MTREEILAARAQYLFQAYMTYFPDDPLVLKRGSMQYVWDLEGREYLDAFSSVVTISAGHCHPEVVEALVEQASEAQHFTTLYPEGRLAEAAEKLVGLAPEGLSRVFFTNSGSEANDFAAHAVMRATRRTGLIALLHSFHGRTGTASALTFQKPWRNVPPYKPDVYCVPNPYVFRRPKGMSEQGFLEMCLHYTREVINHACGGQNLAGLWVEPVQGNGGVIHGPSWYYDELVCMVHEAGGFVVADEVQTGLGRTGRMWGCDHWAEKPDVIVVAKPLGNGLPIGAVIAREEISAAFKGLAHFNTGGGNPLSMAAAKAVMDVISREETMENIRACGEELSAGLRGLKERHPLVGDHRGYGLMQGIEIVKADGSPNPDATARVKGLCRDRGVLLGTGGVNHSVFRVKPPYCVTSGDVGIIIRALDESLTESKSLF